MLISSFKKQEDFSLLYKKGRRFFTKNLNFYFIPAKQEQAHFGIVVSRKLSKKAVTRNLIRRRIKALIEKACEQEKDCPQDVLIVANPAAAEASFSELERDFVSFSNRSRQK